MPLNIVKTLANRDDFPIFDRELRGNNPLVYLDSGATSQLPQEVITAVVEHIKVRNAAVNRGSHQLAEEATVAFERARETMASFVGANSAEIIWTKSATEALNLLAYALGNLQYPDAAAGNGETGIGIKIPATKDAPRAIGVGDNIVVTRAEHHANLVPWQELARRTGATLRWLDLDAEGRIDLETLNVIDNQTRVVAFTHASNVTGAVSPVAEIVAAAKTVGALTVLDICQSAPHLPLDLHQLEVDFAAFSAHKMYGPTGVGVCYVKEEHFAWLPKFLFGGSMVEIVTMEGATYKQGAAGFEAGTPAVAEVIGAAQAVQYLMSLGMDQVAAHEAELTAYLLAEIKQVPGVKVLGPLEAKDRLGVVAFSVDGVHPHDVGQVLDADGIAVRVGHHCAQPVHRHFGVASSSRASLGIYNTKDDIDRFIASLKKVRGFFGLERSANE